jgi:pyruvate formate lyase activating enzyme
MLRKLEKGLDKHFKMKKEAMFYKKMKNGKVQCQLCPHFCVIDDSGWGKCRVRENVSGKLYAMSYEEPASSSVDHIEKKPLFHFLPGTNSYSIGMMGCNLGCSFCQNWALSQSHAGEKFVLRTPANTVVKKAKKYKCPSISYTYSEPLVSYEYVSEIMKEAKEQGIKNVIVSNGFINPGPLKKIVKYIDGANIDLKSISDNFYKDICKARLKPVQESLKILKKAGVWIEITNLIIPDHNDSKKEITKLVLWIKKNLGTNVPLHFTGFYPTYKMMHVPSTRLDKLIEARKIAINNGLKYVYIGNLPHNEGSVTYCSKCKKALIVRSGFKMIKNNLKKGKCSCGEKIAGVWD